MHTAIKLVHSSTLHLTDGMPHRIVRNVLSFVANIVTFSADTLWDSPSSYSTVICSSLLRHKINVTS